jgi:hypothetical protein
MKLTGKAHKGKVCCNIFMTMKARGRNGRGRAQVILNAEHFWNINYFLDFGGSKSNIQHKNKETQ